MQVSVILPTYNEAGNIGQLILALIKQLQASISDFEIIVVDDNSPDGTARVVQTLISQNFPIKLIVRKHKRGLATAIYLGLKKASGKIIVLMDSDFNHSPKYLPQLIKPVLASKVDLVIGSRYISGGGMHVTEANRLQFWLSKWGNFFVNKIILHLPVHESLSGFVAFKKSVLKKINCSAVFQGYGDYCIRLLYQLNQVGCSLAEIPVVYGRRQWGQSKTRLLKVFIGYFKTAILLWVRKT